MLVVMDEQASQLPSWALVEPLYRRLLLPGCVLAGLFAAWSFSGKTWDIVLTCIVVAAAIGVVVCLKL